jgi:hypothetical protein
VQNINIQNKETIMKDAREKHPITYKIKPIRIQVNFSTNPQKSRRI